MPPPKALATICAGSVTTPLANMRPLAAMLCAVTMSMLPAWVAMADTSSKPVSVWLKVSALIWMRPNSAAALPPAGKELAAKLVADKLLVLTTPVFCTSGALRVTVPAGPPFTPAVASALIAPLFKMLLLASSKMRPARCTKPVASRVPLLLTTPLCKRLAAWADKMMRPPGALTALLFSTKVLMAAALTTTRLRAPPPSNFSSKDSPAARATVPKFATMTPLLRTSGANMAM